MQGGVIAEPLVQHHRRLDLIVLDDPVQRADILRCQLHRLRIPGTQILIQRQSLTQSGIDDTFQALVLIAVDGLQKPVDVVVSQQHHIAVFAVGMGFLPAQQNFAQVAVLRVDMLLIAAAGFLLQRQRRHTAAAQ